MKNPFIRLAFICIISACCFIKLSADETKLEEILLKLEKNDQAIKNVRFNYFQDISYTLTRELQHVSGQMVFGKPDNFYLKQNKPIEQIIISNGKKVWIYTPAYRQVIVDRVQRWLNSGILPNSTVSLALNWKELRKKYTFEYLGEENGAYMLLLMPIKPDAGGKSNSLNNWKLKLWFDTKDLSPLRVDLIAESVSVITKITGYARDQDIDKKIFNFKTPEGVDVIKMK